MWSQRIFLKKTPNFADMDFTSYEENNTSILTGPEIQSIHGMR